MINLIKNNPFNSLLSLDRPFNNLFNSSLFDDNLFFKKDWMPKTDIIETDQEIKVKMDCPGISPDKIKITYINNLLTISGENEKEHEEKDYYKLERYFGSFSRSFLLPMDINEESITAEYKNGVVSIFAKKTESNKNRKIEIKINNEDNQKVLSVTGG